MLTVCVGINEEVWFRRLVLAALRGLGDRRASSRAPASSAPCTWQCRLRQVGLYLLLRAVFAAEVGVVLGALVALTHSLWIGVAAWHLVYDLTAYCTGDPSTADALAGVIVMMIVLAGYATCCRKCPPVLAPRSVDVSRPATRRSPARPSRERQRTRAMRRVFVADRR